MGNFQFKVVLTFIILIILSFLLITYQIRIKMLGPSLRVHIFEYLSPVEKLITFIPDMIDDFIHNYRYFKSRRDKIRLLEKENIYLRNTIDDLYAYKNEFRRLENLLGFQKHSGFRHLPARVIGMSGFDLSRDFIIDLGKEHGIEVYDPVISESGILGYVIEVYSDSSVIRNIISHKSAIAVYLENDGINGIIKGNGTMTANIFYIPQNVDISLPQRVYTSGLDGLFPRNLFVGEIIRYEKDPSKFFYDIIIQLNSSPINCRYLYLLKEIREYDDETS